MLHVWKLKFQLYVFYFHQYFNMHSSLSTSVHCSPGDFQKMHKLLKNFMNWAKASKSLVNWQNMFLPSDLALISMKAYENMQTIDREEYFRQNHLCTRINSIILKFIVQFMGYISLLHFLFLSDHWILPIFLLIKFFQKVIQGKKRIKHS